MQEFKLTQKGKKALRAMGLSPVLPYHYVRWAETGQLEYLAQGSGGDFWMSFHGPRGGYLYGPLQIDRVPRWALKALEAEGIDPLRFQAAHGVKEVTDIFVTSASVA